MEDDERTILMITLSQPSSVEFVVTINTADLIAMGMYRIQYITANS